MSTKVKQLVQSTDNNQVHDSIAADCDIITIMNTNNNLYNEIIKFVLKSYHFV